MSITIRVYGEPAPQGSKARGRHGGVYEMSPGLPAWRKAVEEAARQAMFEINQDGEQEEEVENLLWGPLALTVVFLLRRPADHFRRGRFSHLLKPGAPVRPDKRPDTSKLVRGTEDALTKAGIWTDDGQVADLCAAKVYCAPGQEPGARIEIEPCKEGTTSEIA